MNQLETVNLYRVIIYRTEKPSLNTVQRFPHNRNLIWINHPHSPCRRIHCQEGLMGGISDEPGTGRIYRHKVFACHNEVHLHGFPEDRSKTLLANNGVHNSQLGL